MWKVTFFSYNTQHFSEVNSLKIASEYDQKIPQSQTANSLDPDQFNKTLVMIWTQNWHFKKEFFALRQIKSIK